MGKGSGKGSSSGYYLRGGHAAHASTTVESLALHAHVSPHHAFQPQQRNQNSNSIHQHTKQPYPFSSHLHWRPKGLLNVGNTCYANAALQCLLSTALTHALLDPKASAIFRRYSSNPNLLEQGSGSVDSNDDATTESVRLKRRIKEAENKRMHENCRWLSRELKSITLEYLRQDSTPPPPSISDLWSLTSLGSHPNNTVVDPASITKFPDRLSKCLRPYQQEDAHEFMRALLSTLIMNGQNKSLSSLFDGLLESAVTCLHCRRPSLTRDRYMDLSLDILGNVKTLQDALDDFTKTETLTGDNKVFCSKCETKRVATKGLRLATAPSILVCHLKRFAFDPYGRLVRLSNHIQFPLRLEIGDYMSRVNKARPPPYELVAVLVHQGQTCDAGHYFAFVKSDGEWYKCNDSEVTRVDVQVVLAQQAYILVYEVEEMRAKNGYSSPGGASNNKSWRESNSTKQSNCSLWRDYFLGSALCGLDETLLRDFCWDVSNRKSPKHHHRSGGSCGGDLPSSESVARGRRRRRRRSQSQRSSSETVGSSSYHDDNATYTTNGAHDDLSTLGESTVESADTSNLPFRRISSSDNFKMNNHHHHPLYNGRQVMVSSSERTDRHFNDDWVSTPPPPTPFGANQSPIRKPRVDLPPLPPMHRKSQSANPPPPLY